MNLQYLQGLKQKIWTTIPQWNSAGFIIYRHKKKGRRKEVNQQTLDLPKQNRTNQLSRFLKLERSWVIHSSFSQVLFYLVDFVPICFRVQSYVYCVFMLSFIPSIICKFIYAELSGFYNRVLCLIRELLLSLIL